MEKRKKLLAAVEILAGTHFADMDTEKFIQSLESQQVNEAEIYQAMEDFGYRWERETWQRIFPAWLEDLIAENIRQITDRWEIGEHTLLNIAASVKTRCS